MSTSRVDRSGAVNWTELAQELGSWHGSSESCNTLMAIQALDRIVGEETIRAAVNLVIANEPGRLLAQYVLQQMISQRGAAIAYDIYRTSQTDRTQAYWAVKLITTIGHPDAVQWIPHFLADADPDMALMGMDVLDSLVGGSARFWLDDADIEAILTLAAAHRLLAIRTRAMASRVLLDEDLDEATRDTRYLALLQTAAEQARTLSNNDADA